MKTDRKSVKERPKYFYKKSRPRNEFTCEVCGHEFAEKDVTIEYLGPSYSEILTRCPKCGTEYYD